LRSAVGTALRAGDVADARRLMASDPSPDAMHLRDVTAWPDAWLVSAARCEPPDVAALDALVARYWQMLYGRCQLLTLDRQTASDLAQDTWCRVLRARRTLDPDGNVPAFLATVATNIWRDRHRASRRAGPLAEHRLASLDAPRTPMDDGVILADMIPALDALPIDEQVQLTLDVDRALARLTPRARDVVTARYVTGESAAEIGRRYGRTEQTISGWLRDAVRELRRYLGDSLRDDARRSGR
jgi:RNA polymerase sigma-70 factor (ECF subfamily)